MEPGDVVLADKGFPGINVRVENKHRVNVFPPFSKRQLQFTNDEMEMMYQVAQVRIYIERAIQRVNVFNILNSRVPTELISSMTDIVRMCCVLVNLQHPIIAKKSQQPKILFYLCASSFFFIFLCQLADIT